MHKTEPTAIRDRRIRFGLVGCGRIAQKLVEDTAAVDIRWRSGALGLVNVTMLTHPKNFDGTITIIGEKGTARVGGVAVCGRFRMCCGWTQSQGKRR